MAQDQFVDDVSSLDIDPPNEEYWGDYEDAATRKPTPPKGQYYLRMPEKFKYARSKSGGLKISLGPLLVVGGEHDGYEIRYPQDVSTTKFKNSNASSAADVLRNFHTTYDGDGKATYTGPSPSTKEEWAAAFAAIAGQITPNPVYCDRFGWDKVEKKEYKGKDFVETDKLTVGEGSEQRTVFGNLKPTLRGFSVPETKKAAA